MATSTSSHKPVTVLIIDDDPLVTETFARILRLEGYIVRTAFAADTGLHEAEVSHPDAILLDLRMPVVDGLGFLRQLRARAPQQVTPVAIVTGDYFFDDAVSNELRELGAQVYFKPIWLDDLIQITQAWSTCSTESDRNRALGISTSSPSAACLPIKSEQPAFRWSPPMVSTCDDAFV